MAPPSKISQLPQDLRDALVARIMESGFSDYDGHTSWLGEELERRGIEVEGGISRAAIHREGRKLEDIGERVKAMQMMQAGWQQQMGNRGIGELGRVLNAQLQGLAFALTQDVAEGKVEMDVDFLKGMSQTLMRLERSAEINEARDQKIREEERQLANEEAARKVEKIARKGGMTKTTADAIRREILGIK